MNEQDKKELRQIVREETLSSLSMCLPILAERIEKAISSLGSDSSNNHSEGTSVLAGDPIPVG